MHMNEKAENTENSIKESIAMFHVLSLYVKFSKHTVIVY